MSNTLGKDDFEQIGSVIQGYENWRVARTKGSDWYSLSAYLDELALHRRSDILDEVIEMVRRDEDVVDILEGLRNILGIHDA